MAARRVPARQVERTIVEPNRRYPSTDPAGRLIAERETEVGGTLRGAYVESAGPSGLVRPVVTVIPIGSTLR